MTVRTSVRFIEDGLLVAAAMTFWPLRYTGARQMMSRDVTAGV